MFQKYIVLIVLCVATRISGYSDIFMRRYDQYNQPYTLTEEEMSTSPNLRTNTKVAAIGSGYVITWISPVDHGDPKYHYRDADIFFRRFDNQGNVLV